MAYNTNPNIKTDKTSGDISQKEYPVIITEIWFRWTKKEKP